MNDLVNRLRAGRTALIELVQTVDEVIGVLAALSAAFAPKTDGRTAAPLASKTIRRNRGAREIVLTAAEDWGTPGAIAQRATGMTRVAVYKQISVLAQAGLLSRRGPGRGSYEYRRARGVRAGSR